MILSAKAFLHVGLCLMLVQSNLAYSAGPDDHPLAEMTARHRAAALAEDFATLGNARIDRNVTLQSSANSEDLSIHDADGHLLFTIKFVYDGKGELKGLPTSVVSSIGKSADLAPAWKAIMATYKAKHEAFTSLRETGTQAEFEAWFASSEKLGELLLPVDQIISKLIQDSFSIRAQYHVVRSEVDDSRPKPSRINLDAVNRWGENAMFHAIWLGMGLATYGFYQYVSGPGGLSDPNYYSSFRPQNYGLIELFAGVAMFVPYFINSAPTYFYYDTFLERILIGIKDRRFSREQAKLRAQEMAKVAELKAEIDKHANAYQFGSTTLRLFLGSLTDVEADAWVVPEFAEEAHSGGVVAAIERAGGTPGINAYQALIDREGPPAHGSVIVTESGPNTKAAHLMHVVTVGSSGYEASRNHPAAAVRKEYSLVRDTLIKAIRDAREHGFKKIVVPELGTGIIGELDGEGLASLQALLESIAASEKQSPAAAPLEIVLALWRHPRAFATYDAFVTKAMSEGIRPNPAFQRSARDAAVWACEKDLRGQK